MAGCGVIVGDLIRHSVVVYHHDSQQIHSQWVPTLLAIGTIILAAFFNIYLARIFPLFEGIVLFIHLAGWAAVVVTLWIMSPRAAASETLLSFANGGGWSSAGASTLIGVLTPLSALVGYDSAVHMSNMPTNTTQS